jgi:Ran GTPase-activating protein (RanGAP) involved in mRNA processing and transport
MASLGRALKTNVLNGSTLETLCLSNNTLGNDGSTALAAFLAMPNPLRVLRLAHAQVFVVVVVVCLFVLTLAVE